VEPCRPVWCRTRRIKLTPCLAAPIERLRRPAGDREHNPAHVPARDADDVQRMGVVLHLRQAKARRRDENRRAVKSSTAGDGVRTQPAHRGVAVKHHAKACQLRVGRRGRGKDGEQCPAACARRVDDAKTTAVNKRGRLFPDLLNVGGLEPSDEEPFHPLPRLPAGGSVRPDPTVGAMSILCRPFRRQDQGRAAVG
jgi:hypothetical protein